MHARRKTFFLTFSLPEEIQRANCSSLILLSKAVAELVHTACFSSPKSDSEMKWRHSSCIQLSLRCRGQKLTTRPWEQTGQRKLTSHPTFFTQKNFLHTRSMIEVSWLRKARIESTSTTSVALFTLRATTSIVEEWQRRTREGFDSERCKI